MLAAGGHGLAAAQTTFAPDAEKRELVVAIYLAGAPISSVAAKGHLVSSLAAALTSALGRTVNGRAYGNAELYTWFLKHSTK